MDSEEGCEKVELYIYDLSQGMAAMSSMLLLGKHIEGIWHTSVVVFGREFFYGAQGIQSCIPGGTVLGKPQKVEQIGDTYIPYQVFRDYVRGLAESAFRGSSYSLLAHNCNTFSNDLCQFLSGCYIPKYILDLPQEFLSTPLGQTIAPLIDRIGGSETSGNFLFEPHINQGPASDPEFDELNSQIEEARLQSLALTERRNEIKEKLAKKERKKEKKRKKVHFKEETTSECSSGSGENRTMSEANGTNGDAIIIPSEMLPSEQALEDEEREREEEAERKKQREPVIVFNTIDPKVELDALVQHLDGKLTVEEQQALEELHQYLLLGEGSWALGEGFLIFVERVLRDDAVSSEVRVHLLRALANAALKDDVILLLHQDRRDHVLMNYAHDIEKHSIEEQQALTLFMVNLFENLSPSEWLLYISEWSYNNNQTSNIRASTKVAVHSLLTTNADLLEYGTAFIHNLACKEVKTVVFDDVAVELAMAILQFFSYVCTTTDLREPE